MENRLPHVEIRAIRAEPDISGMRMLFREYEASIGVDLEYQGFSAELAALPGEYAPPSGELLLAVVANEPAGCVALRSLDRSTLEMKRLYVKPTIRGLGLGKRLVEAAISTARQRDYAQLRLDTLGTMESAQELYRKMGFVEIPPYGKSHLPGTRFYGLTLR
jgi:ribosomal protein S18 acetylase RimI-like enzyme